MHGSNSKVMASSVLGTVQEMVVQFGERELLHWISSISIGDVDFATRDMT